MQANSAEHQPLESATPILGVASGLVDGNHSATNDLARPITEPTYFQGYYTSCMEMYANAQLVAEYLDGHHDWFKRCAHPMKVEPLGNNGYDLTVGRFGSFGYEVEPKIGLDLLPQDHGIYRIQTIPIPGYDSPGYEVDFRAAMHLVQVDTDPTVYSLPPHAEKASLPAYMTQVEWDLNLKVTVHFPRFIHALPKSLVQTTGDRLLNQIVRQVSRCLTAKVQEDFHNTREIPFLRKRRKYPWNRGHDATRSEQE